MKNSDTPVNMSSDKQSNRQSNVELLRIIGMLMMIGNHYLSGSGLQSCFDYSVFSWRMYFFQCVGVWGKTLINTFVLITGYFMCKRNLSVGQWIKLFMRGKFYLIAFWGLFIILGVDSLSVKCIIRVVFAEILDINQGFASSFLLFYLLIPFCNKLINVMNKQWLRVLIFLGIIIYAIPAWFGNGDTFNYVAWFVVIYFLGAYIRLYEPAWMGSRRICGVLLIVLFLLAFLSIALIDIGGPKFDFYDWSFLIKDSSSKPFAILIGTVLFLFFKNLRIPYSRAINSIAATTYGVLWFHTATPTWRNILWNNIFHVKEQYYAEWWKLPVYFVFAVVAIFSIGSMIDMLYAKLIEKPLLNKMRAYSWFNRNLWDFKE